MKRGLERTESIRHSLPDLPEADEVQAVLEEWRDELRDQAQPVLDRAEKQGKKGAREARKVAALAAARATSRTKPKRSKKPFLLLGLLLLVGVVAYILFNRRDQEPAYLMAEPDQPDIEPASGPESPATPNSPVDAPSNGMPSGGSPWSPAPAPGAPRTLAGTTASVEAPAPTTPVTPITPEPTPAPTMAMKADPVVEPVVDEPEAQPADEPVRAETPSYLTPPMPSVRPSQPVPAASVGASTPVTPPPPLSIVPPSKEAPTSTSTSTAYDPLPRPIAGKMAAWDLPPSIVPPTR